MSVKPLLIFDFDGVIVDGLVEYWNSAQQAYFKMMGKENYADVSNFNVPKNFRILRPWVKNGWEMVLLAAEILNSNSSLNLLGPELFSNHYQENCSRALTFHSWKHDQLQQALDNVRQEAIKKNLNSWLDSHQAFPFVVKRLKQIIDEDIEFGVLTTKSSEFTSQLLDHLNLYPSFIYGHEFGEKTKVLLEISKKRTIAGFVEDRRATLETVLKTPGLKTIPCYLAAWGYLKPDDCNNLPMGMYLLETTKFICPLANWS